MPNKIFHSLWNRITGRQAMLVRITQLEDALLPFALARVADQSQAYPGTNNTVVQTPVTKAMCQHLQGEYDRAIGKGAPVYGNRPDPDDGSRDWPHEFLSMDDLVIEDWRRARFILDGHPLLNRRLDLRMQAEAAMAGRADADETSRWRADGTGKLH